MPRGGKRPNGGRPKGSKNKATIAKEILMRTAITGVDPVAQAARTLGGDYDAKDLLRAIYTDDTLPGDIRFAAAVKAMPFERAKPTANKGNAPASMVFNFGRHAKSA